MARESIGAMSEDDKIGSGLEFDFASLPQLSRVQHWTRITGLMQQAMMEHAAAAMAESGKTRAPLMLWDVDRLTEIQAEFTRKGTHLWQSFMPGSADRTPLADRRFSSTEWQSNPLFELIARSYLIIADAMLGMADAVDGIPQRDKDKLRFATRNLVDAISPANFPMTNPKVLERTIETGGENLVKGFRHMLADLEKGQLTHTDGNAFEVGRNIAATPGKVIHETPLYQLIQYTPTTDKVDATPLLIFPPWINRFYILDLHPDRSMVKWLVDQGISLFMVSWKSADETMKDLTWDDYVRAQIDAIDTVRDLLDVPSVDAVGYCVAGTTLAATLSILGARGQADKVRSATFFTAQVDFSEAGDLTLFVDDEQLALIESLSAEGYLDGRYMAATFNLLRGRDLIWNYVVNNYLLGQDYPPFDLLYWNGDTTNVPAKWHQAYLADLYRDNRLVQPGSLSVDGTPIDLGKIATPCLIQAGREDHIAPPQSVWKLMDNLTCEKRFVLAGSGHIAGVVNPPAAQKYGYWTGPADAASLEDFVDRSESHKGSWWPLWIDWLRTRNESKAVAAKGGRIPGKGKRKGTEDAPGRYVKMH